jgi:hypothetical protein
MKRFCKGSPEEGCIGFFQKAARRTMGARPTWERMMLAYFAPEPALCVEQGPGGPTAPSDGSAAIAKQFKMSRSSVHRVLEGHRGARLRLIASKNRARMRRPFDTM